MLIRSKGRWRGQSPQWGIWNFVGRIIYFFIEWWEFDKEGFWSFEHFSKLKPILFKYWTSIKIKVSMTYVNKDYKVKIKMIQEQWLQLKMSILRSYNMKNCCLEDGINLWWGRIKIWLGESNAGGFFLVGGLPFSAIGGNFPQPHIRENPDL